MTKNMKRQNQSKQCRKDAKRKIEKIFIKNFGGSSHPRFLTPEGGVYPSGMKESQYNRQGADDEGDRRKKCRITTNNKGIKH